MGSVQDPHWYLLTVLLCRFLQADGPAGLFRLDLFYSKEAFYSSHYYFLDLCGYHVVIGHS
jgi:hypothetical protein